jgi:hypothetical protein
MLLVKTRPSKIRDSLFRYAPAFAIDWMPLGEPRYGFWLGFCSCEYNHLVRVAEVAIIGAGPYGLSVAAHLRRHGVDFRIFGRPMRPWLTQMPRGMFLKSESFATNISDPDDKFTLQQFCEEQRIPYRSDVYESHCTAVPVETFIAYGLSFQKRFVPEVEERDVIALEKSSDCFVLRLEDGEAIRARNVVVAVGLSHFQYIPPELSHMPRDVLSHSSDHSDLSGFRDRRVAVIGAGASAVEFAALLHETGADVHLVARRRHLAFQPVPTNRAPWRRAIRPMSAIGYGWHSALLSEVPAFTWSLPLPIRVQLVRRYQQPCAGWFMKDRVVGQFPLHLGCTRLRGEFRDGRVHLQIAGEDAEHELAVDHIIAATGYLPDLDRLTFLSDELRSGVRSAGRSPVLSLDFQSSVSGLYFVGPLSSISFGPPMRFVHGARFTAHRVSGHLSRSLARNPATDAPFRDRNIKRVGRQVVN